jgi:hypothetical protein
MAVTPEMITKVRMEIADTDPVLRYLSDDEITYFLESNYESIAKASIKAAYVICMKLSQGGDEISGILSIKGSKAAEQYRMALESYIKSPTTNPILNGFGSYTDDSGEVKNPLYMGGISNKDIQANKNNLDNNYIPDPIYEKSQNKVRINPFLV